MSMFLPYARATQLGVAYLVFTVAVVMVPKADNPKTLFDEANTPTNEMVAEKAASFMVAEKAASFKEYRESVTASMPTIFPQSRRLSVWGILPVYADLLTGSRAFRELFCFLLC
jgi:hypothetical protein